MPECTAPSGFCTNTGQPSQRLNRDLDFRWLSGRNIIVVLCPFQNRHAMQASSEQRSERRFFFAPSNLKYHRRKGFDWLRTSRRHSGKQFDKPVCRAAIQKKNCDKRRVFRTFDLAECPSNFRKTPIPSSRCLRPRDKSCRQSAT